ncbi:Transcription factor [Metarhizium rileyi]|uniref:Transcription factor n=1 Tax=Metarhizium rileyi (strain RCEF 4871) TaxID=1649241 RepID=A0A162M443_METRR|nr:Transcription factor [Metarhizium rileyi RCEF 4871]
MRPSALACTECRRHHLKCDAKRPSCSRCATTQNTCTYLPSRRGGKRKAFNGNVQGHGTVTIVKESPALPLPPHQLVRPDHHLPRTSEDILLADATHDAPSSSGVPTPREGKLEPYVPEDRLVRLFYENFHQAHPILVPPGLYERQNYPPYLHQVVKFIGSHYSMVLSGNEFYDSTTSALSANAAEKSPCMVQALLLYSIIMCARNERLQAETSLSQAITIALDTGMYQKDVMASLVDNREFELESLRRTWWELFIWEICMRSLQQKLDFRCSDVLSDVLLPCEESTYASLQSIPQPKSLAEFRARVFADDDDDAAPSEYSSFTYRIEAFHILARVLVLNSIPETHPDRLQAIANTLVSWAHLLPPQKIDIVDTYGGIDEMLFQAQFIIHYAAMLLHLPRSNLRPRFPEQSTAICPMTPVRLSPSLTRNVHDVKTIGASKELSNLLSVHGVPQGYSPSVVFGTVFCGLVQLAASETHSSECADHHLNRVVLALGNLKILRTKWNLAQQAYRHLKSAAKQTSTIRPDGRPLQETHTPPPNPRYPMVTDGTIIGSSADYDTVHGSISSLFLSAYIDPTCSDPFSLNQMSEF